MIALLIFIWRLLLLPSRSELLLEAENAALRQQLIILQPKARGRAQGTVTTGEFGPLDALVSHQD
jgi:hypothetical protein